MCKRKRWNNMVPLKLKLSYIRILLEQFIFLLERLFQIVLFPPPGNILDKNQPCLDKRAQNSTVRTVSIIGGKWWTHGDKVSQCQNANLGCSLKFNFEPFQTILECQKDISMLTQKYIFFNLYFLFLVILELYLFFQWWNHTERFQQSLSLLSEKY